LNKFFRGFDLWCCFYFAQFLRAALAARPSAKISIIPQAQLFVNRQTAQKFFNLAPKIVLDVQ
jgi:hypothetical protein